MREIAAIARVNHTNLYSCTHTDTDTKRVYIQYSYYYYLYYYILLLLLLLTLIIARSATSWVAGHQSQ